MPPAEQPVAAGLLDAWGRRNRQLPDRACPQCGVSFHPLKQASRYCSRRCAWANNGGRNKQTEGWWLNPRGYVEGFIWIGGVRRAVKQHRWVMEQHLGRPLTADEDIHHRNGDTTDNRIENLEVMAHGAHSTNHNHQRAYRRGYTLNLTEEQRRARAERMRAMRQAQAAEGRAGDGR